MRCALHDTSGLIVFGFFACVLQVVWKSFEAYSQFSLRNQLLVVTDFLRTKLFGRDISRV